MVGRGVAGDIRAGRMVVEPRADKCGFAADGNGDTELVVGLCIAGEQFGLLNPSESGPDEDIGGTGVTAGVVVFPRPDDDVVSVDVNRMSELVAERGIFSGEFCLLCPSCPAAGKEIRRPRINSNRIVSGGTNNRSIATDCG